MRCSPPTRQVKAGLSDEVGVYLNFDPARSLAAGRRPGNARHAGRHRSGRYVVGRRRCPLGHGRARVSRFGLACHYPVPGLGAARPMTHVEALDFDPLPTHVIVLVRRGYVDLELVRFELALEDPYGMVLGVFTFIVLCRDRVARLFAGAR
jgi:hypothetical protein